MLAAACALPPRLDDASRSGVWGYVRLVPREGVAPASEGPYADRRYADAELVDYTRPGFAVVYLDGPAPSPLQRTVSLESGVTGVRLDPARLAVPVGSEIRVENRSRDRQVVSCPDAGVLRSLAPGESLAFRALEPGGLEILLPGSAEARALVFAAPGPFTVSDRAGRYELLDVAPGAGHVHVWHPRFPPARRAVELSRGHVQRLDLELGVGRSSAGVRHE